MKDLTPFRFGASVNEQPDARSWTEKAKRVEGLGYSTLLIADHLVNPFAPTPALAVAAAVTTTLRVGTMVYANDFRHPAILAKDIATLDVLTGGRVEVGIGAGWLRAEYEAAGLTFDAPRVRVERLAESIEIMKNLWSCQPFSFGGSHYTITEMTGAPPPVQHPHPPLMIGGSGARILDLAADHADIISFAPSIDRETKPVVSSLGSAAISERVARIRAHRGSRPVELSIYYGTPARLTDDRRAAAEQIASEATARYGREVTPDVVGDSPFYLYGTIDECSDLLIERRERFGISYLVICGDESVEQMAPLVDRLTGT